jgi:hypothetical protein
VALIFFETGSGNVAQAGFEFSILLPHPQNAGITGACHHTRLESGLETRVSYFFCLEPAWGRKHFFFFLWDCGLN